MYVRSYVLEHNLTYLRYLLHITLQRLRITSKIGDWMSVFEPCTLILEKLQQIDYKEGKGNRIKPFSFASPALL